MGVCNHDLLRRLASSVKLRHLGIASLATGWVGMTALVLLANQPDTALTTPWLQGIQRPIQTVVPEQWAFFTKSPREDSLTSFRLKSSGELDPATVWPNSSAAAMFGISRSARGQAIELGAIASRIKPDDWSACRPAASLKDCVAAKRTTPRRVADNTAPEPTICGPLWLAQTSPAPWAFAAIGQAHGQQSIARVTVQC
ncbi:SdpA family antimicrobial peptide system protein [Frondihabitans sp. 4ASC-45]|uniref:SdpA family antimicrobial peptide system protein n=1 Tax=Frondihabitans sp. 4ASC-45 TaxID=3111636 RepID=UPI003C306BF9